MSNGAKLLQIPTPFIHFAADDLNLSDGDPVEVWPDLGPNGYDAFATKSPAVFKENATPSGKPALYLDHTPFVVDSFEDILQPHTIFVVWMTETGGHVLEGDDRQGYMILRAFNGQMMLFAGQVIQYAPEALEYWSHTFIADGETSSIREKGEEKASGNAGESSFEQLRIGDGEAGLAPFIGEIAEVIVYEKRLSQSEIETVENYLYEKYFTVDGLPVPYMHFAADDLDLSDGDPVEVWPDKGPNGLDAEAAHRPPVFKESVTHSGKPAVRFDRSPLGTSEFDALEQPNTIFIVWKADNSGRVLDGRSDGSCHIVETYSGGIRMFAGSWLTYDRNVPFPDFLIHTAAFDGSSSVLREMGKEAASGNAGSYDVGRLTIGSHWDFSREQLTGDVAEIIVYDRSLSTSEIEVVERYLHLKYFAHPVSGVVPAQSTVSAGLRVRRDVSGQSYAKSRARAILDVEKAIIREAFIRFAADAINLNDDDPVEVWPDSSKNELHAEALNNFPVFKTNITPMGKPVVRFNRSPLATPEFAETEQPNTIIVIWQVHETGRLLDGQSDGLRHIIEAAADEVRMYAGSWLAHGRSVPFAGLLIHTAVFDGSSSILREMRSEVAAGNAGSRPTTMLTIGSHWSGGREYFVGDLAELIFYDRALSETEIRTVEKYLYDKYMGPFVEGSITAQSEIKAVLQARRHMDGRTHAQSTAGGRLRRNRKAAGTASSASDVSGAVGRRRSVKGRITLVSGIQGRTDRDRRVLGRSAAASQVQGAAFRVRGTRGRTNSFSGVLGHFKIHVPVRGDVEARSQTTGHLAISTENQLGGRVDGRSSVRAAMQRRSMLRGHVPSRVDVSGLLQGLKPFGGDVRGRSAVAAPVLVGHRPLRARIVAVSSMRGEFAESIIVGVVCLDGVFDIDVRLEGEVPYCVPK